MIAMEESDILATIVVLFIPLIFLIIAWFAGNIFNPYWFQFGIKSGGNASFNNGARVEIQTIVPQNITNGSLVFWIGETLSNGAFLQVGYTINNKVDSRNAEWFYEYFPSNSQGSLLVPGNYSGAIGPNGSAGANGTFHTYGFYSIGDTWYFTFDGKVIGNTDLGTNNSGANKPEAIGELDEVNTNNIYVKDVIFSNLSIYKHGIWLPVSSGYTYIGYGQGSKQLLKNPYGVEEIDNIPNYFVVGSGLPQFNGVQLWTLNS